jgi:hypothetical protein
MIRALGKRQLTSASPSYAAGEKTSSEVAFGRVEDGRGSLSHAATLRFPSPLIEPDVPISGIRLSRWLHLRGVSSSSFASRYSFL